MARLVNQQNRADNWAQASSRLSYLVSQAIGLRQVIPIEIKMTVTVGDCVVYLSATVEGQSLGIETMEYVE